MSKVQIDPSTFQFLKTLSKNNNREWFNTHKNKYLDAHQNMCDVVYAILSEMKKHDELTNESGKKSLLRIYSDVRFSKDKAPYNPRFAFRFQRATKLKRGGYYVNLTPGNSYLSCGFFSPNSEDLKRIRQDIEMNYSDWKKLLKTKSIQDNFGELRGKKLESAPRGFSKAHDGIELLKHKQFIFRHNFTDEDVLSPGFAKEVNRLFKAIRPFFNYMSEILTTDLNGEMIV
jgi:uncharacterized protein (TIGR02453 family)